MGEKEMKIRICLTNQKMHSSNDRKDSSQSLKEKIMT